MSDSEDLQEFNKKLSRNHSKRKGWVKDSEPEVPTSSDADAGQISETITREADAKMWAVYSNTFSPCEKAVDILPPGQYTIETTMERGTFFSKKTINLDDLMVLPDSAAEDVIAGIELFWTKEEHFRKFGFLWKRGILLWGPAGSGKTSAVQIISKLIVDQGGLSVYIQNPELGARGLELMRRIEPDRPIVVILEDIDAIAERYGESDLLALLDGELQIDNVIFIATTNYPERLDKRLTNRPSRFDIVKKIGMPSDEARYVYLKAKNKRLSKNKNHAELEVWVKQTKYFSLAHLKELIISVEVFELPLNEAINRLKSMINVNVTSEGGIDNQQIGFRNS